jgi:peroxiredoxin
MKRILLACMVLLGISVSAQTIDERGYKVKVGDIAPDFSIQLTNGKSIRLSTLRGKTVMLQFTASWCSVCRKEMPFIERDIWAKYKDKADFSLIAIDRDEPLPTVKKFAASIPITYPIGLDPKADIFALYADREAGVTRNVIIDKEGKIVMLTRLYTEEEFKRMTDLLATIVK